MTHKFIIGKNDYLFLDNDTNHVLQQIQGEISLAPDVLSEIHSLHTDLSHTLLNNNCHYMYIVAPNKETSLREYLPAGIIYERFGPTPIHQLQRTTHDTGIYLYFDDNILSPSSQLFATYDKGDSHWTPQAAIQYFCAALQHFGMSALVSRLHETKFLPVDNCALGDLGRHAGRAPEQIEQVKLLSPYSVTLFEGPIVNEGYIRHTYCEHRKGRAVIFHDSFVHALLPILSEMFENSLFVHCPDYIQDIVEAFAPDVVIRLQVERFFVRTPRIIKSALNWIAEIQNNKHSDSSTSLFIEQLLNNSIPMKPQKTIRKDKFLFCHIPKNAGTSLVTALIDNFQWSEIFGLDNRKLFLKDLVDNQTDIIATHSLISGHIPLKVLEENLHQFDLIIAIVRPPMERFLSHYFFWKKQNYVPSEMSIDDFLEVVFRSNADTRNEQCGFLGKINTFESVIERMNTCPALRIIPYHNLASIHGLADEFGLPRFAIPKINASEANETRWDLVSSKLYESVFEWFSDDFRLSDFLVDRH